MRVTDILLAATMWALALFTFTEARSFSAQAAQFPILIACVLAAFGLMLILNSMRQRRGAHVFPFKDVPWRPLLSVIATLLAFTVSVDMIGFYESGFLFAAVTCWLLLIDTQLGRSPLRSIARAASFALMLMAGVYIAFHVILQVPTPRGIFL